jgi:hypothetical protein
MQNNTKLTINNFEKLKGKYIDLYKIDMIREADDMYQLRAQTSYALAPHDESLVITIHRDETTSGEYRHVLTKFDVEYNGDRTVREIEWVLPIRLIRDMEGWLHRMELAPPEHVWKVIR